jgi:phospholipid/cholesterol/gamma-HCH transport system ATP-binding protein
MEIGDNILFISEGEMCWEGNRKEILHSTNQKLQEFVFANKQYQRIRDDKIKE